MKRLIQGIGKNSPQEYNRLFMEREPDWQDLRRWKWLMKYYTGGKVIDLGCLNSRINLSVKDSKNYLGVDMAAEAVGRMKKMYPHADFMVGDVYRLRLSANQYDYAILGEVLEHLEQPEKAVKEAFRILKSDGVLAISVPLEEEKEPGAVDGERHIWSYDKNDFQEMLSQYSSKVRFKILRSKWFPYKYCWPQLICWAWKK